MTEVLSQFPALQQAVAYVVETICETKEGPMWRPLLVREVKIGSKFLTFHPDYVKWMRHPTRSYQTHDGYIQFTDVDVAMELAQALTKFWHMPLRVMRVQCVRVQHQHGKILLPLGGV